MRVFPWFLALMFAAIGNGIVGLADAAEPSEPAKLPHVAPTDFNRPPSPAQAIRSLLSTDQDRVFQARKRVARASYVASKIQAGDVGRSKVEPGKIEQVDYSVLGSEDEHIPMEGEIIMEGPAVAGIHDPATYHDGGGCSSCQSGYSCNSGCGDCNSCGSCRTCRTICFPLCFSLPLENLSFRAGPQGFKGPLNAGMDGSFGFLYGVNWGAPLFSQRHGFGVQLGVNGANSNFDGASFTNDSRDQFFLTGGFFRRVDWGWQGGLVYDYMSDHWYYNVNASQLRGELSWKFQCKGELGFWFTASDKTSTINSVVNTPGTVDVPMTIAGGYKPNNMFAFFYRHPLDICGGDIRFSGGWTNNQMGLLGADMNIPITKCLAVETNFLYLIPKNNSGQSAYTTETWNVGIYMVWYPRACSSSSAGKSYYRPLFNVASNATFSMYPN